MIVDNGSCINRVSKQMMEQLGLSIVPHPATYDISGIDASSLPVMHQYNVPLKVSTFDEGVVCDVLPIKVGSIILGCPWLNGFDVTLREAGRTEWVAQYSRRQWCETAHAILGSNLDSVGSFWRAEMG